MSHRVIVDANVWYSRTLRGWMLMLEQESAPYKTYWTWDILAEVMNNLRRKHPTWSGGKITDVQRKITQTVEGGCVEDYEIDGTSPWADPNDQHVHAAALACSAGYIVTDDKGFADPGVDTDSLPYEVYKPDAFLELVDDASPEAVRQVIARQAEYFLDRHGEVDLCSALRRSGCPRFAERVRRHLQTMDLSFINRHPR